MKGKKTRLYEISLDGVARAVDSAEHFQKPDKNRSSYKNVLAEVSDRWETELEDLRWLREFDEAVEKVCTERADDIIKPWFTFEPAEGEDELPEGLLGALNEWTNHIWIDSKNQTRKQTIQQFLMRALDTTNWSGNGFLYKIYDDIASDENLDLVKEEPSPTARIIGYQWLPRERVTFDDSNDKQFFYAYNNMSSSSVTEKKDFAFLNIHPSRMIDLVLKDNPEGSWSGQSIMHSAIMLLIAKMQTSKDMEFMMARILPKHTLKFSEGENPANKEYVQTNISGLVNRKSVTLPKGMEYDIKGYSGKLIDLTKMYDIFYQALAMAAHMPLDYLKGVSAGRVTGSETNTFQYFKSIHSDQKKIESEVIAEFIDYSKRNLKKDFTNAKFTVRWGSVEAPDKTKESLQRLRNSQADKALFDAGLSIETVNVDRKRSGLPELEIPEGQEAAQVQQTRIRDIVKGPFIDKHQLEDKHAKILTRIYRKIEDDIDKVVGRSESFVGRVLHRMPNERDIDRIVDAHTDEILDAVEDLHEEAIFTGVAKASETLGTVSTRTFLSPQELDFIRDRSLNEITNTTDTIKNDLRRVLIKGREEGKGATEIGRRMKDIVNSRDRAQLIARTETLVSSEFARNNEYKAQGVALKEWTTAGDADVRESHVNAEAEGPIPIDQTFGNGLLHPGDPNGSAEELANCRCALAPVIGQTKPKSEPPKEKAAKQVMTRIKQAGPGEYLITEELKQCQK